MVIVHPPLLHYHRTNCHKEWNISALFLGFSFQRLAILQCCTYTCTKPCVPHHSFSLPPTHPPTHSQDELPKVEPHTVAAITEVLRPFAQTTVRGDPYHFFHALFCAVNLAL